MRQGSYIEKAIILENIIWFWASKPFGSWRFIMPHLVTFNKAQYDRCHLKQIEKKRYEDIMLDIFSSNYLHTKLPVVKILLFPT